MKKGTWVEFPPNVSIEVMKHDLPEWSNPREDNPFEHYSPWPAIIAASCLVGAGLILWGFVLYGIIRLVR